MVQPDALGQFGEVVRLALEQEAAVKMVYRWNPLWRAWLWTGEYRYVPSWALDRDFNGPRILWPSDRARAELLALG